MAKKYKRGIHKESLLNSLLEDGKLRPLVELVKSSNDLVIQIRDDYFNVYYKGGNVARVESPKNLVFDKNYFRKFKSKEEEDWDAIKKEQEKAKQLFFSGQFVKYIDFIIKRMLTYWEKVLDNKGIEEKTTQHSICLNNTEKNDYTILDLEYEVSTRSKFHYRGNRRTPKGKIPSPRFDIIAIRNCDHRLCVIELKKGSKALKDPSGVQEHGESYANTIGYNKQTKQDFVDEMNNVLIQKRDLLGLTGEAIFIDTTLEPEFIYAYQYDSKDENYPTFEKQKHIFNYYKKEKNIDGINYAYDKKVIWLDEGDFTLKGGE